jgi:hypothetical protein
MGLASLFGLGLLPALAAEYAIRRARSRNGVAQLATVQSIVMSLALLSVAMLSIVAMISLLSFVGYPAETIQKGHPVVVIASGFFCFAVGKRFIAFLDQRSARKASTI